jgi:glucose/arabinose dehydrogenase
MSVVEVRKSNSRTRPLTGLVLALVMASVTTACDDDDVVNGPLPDAVLDVELVAEGLTAPVLVREAPDGSDRLFVVDQAGQIRVLDEDGTLLAEPFLDVRSRMVALRDGFDERGLLGLAFHPDYATNGRFFVYYSAPLRAEAPDDFDHTSHISEFTVSATDPDLADPASERVLLQVDQPQFNHDAGTVDFGPDGYLYISLGDGGGANDVGVGHVPGGNGQDIESLLGSILRIDVDEGDPYGIPADNPFVGEDGRDEIFAYGFRNPYRFSFVPGGDALLVGDAGQDLYEEVSLVELGGNYGWNVKEGTHCFDPNDPTNPPADCPDTGSRGEPLIDPVIEYRNAKSGDGVGIVVVGGFIYRGDAIPDLEGLYVFGDYSQSFDEASGQVFAATPVATGLWSFDELRFGDPAAPLNEYVLGFGEDLDGELYVLTSGTGTPHGSTGRVYRLVLR